MRLYGNSIFLSFVVGGKYLLQLMASATLLKVPAEQIVFHPGSLCENYLLMVSGCVRTQLLTESGRELLLYKVKAGDSCVLTTACLLGKNRYPVEGVTDVNQRAKLTRVLG